MQTIEIPAKLRDKVCRTFGAQGEAWVQEAPAIFGQLVAEWELSELQVSSILSYNLVCFAHSPDYGPVALKLGVPNPETNSEIAALDFYGGHHICQLHKSDASLGALLLERISPGHDLTTVSQQTERVSIASRLVCSLPHPLQASEATKLSAAGVPTYETLLKRGFARAKREGKVGSDMLGLITQAEMVFAKLTAQSLPDFLLHGDLNHWNILQDSSGNWKAIDPKGIIGPHALEAGRFVLNELERVPAAEQLPHLAYMIKLFSEQLRQPERNIASGIFLDRVLGTCWSFEDNVPAESLKERVADSLLMREYLAGLQLL